MIHLTVRGARSRVGALLRSAINRKLGELPAGLAGDARTCLTKAADRAREGALRLIKDAPYGSDVQVQLSAVRDALGGWTTSVVVAVSPPAAAAALGALPFVPARDRGRKGLATRASR